ncbi:hypothetical protein PANT111_560029 [Pantoea brenneri]|uniref:Uncharacterized protein n=1 Tax=Pantoea brenneri TaxID=472694 RepID=A0AAX3JCA7_9GAMM|nr:hypothetical protein PANT111_560029 [Pantoea brenneri]
MDNFILLYRSHEVINNLKNNLDLVKSWKAQIFRPHGLNRPKHSSVNVINKQQNWQTRSFASSSMRSRKLPAAG